MARSKSMAATRSSKRRRPGEIYSAEGVDNHCDERQAVCDEIERLNADIDRLKRSCKVLWLSSVSLFSSILFWRTVGNDYLIPWLMWKLTWSGVSVSAVESDAGCGCGYD